MNNGAITTVFSPVVLSTATGSFVTDAGGVLTAVPSNWTDFPALGENPGASTIASSNDPATPTVFFINGFNGVYHNSDNINVDFNAADMTNVGNNIIAANWTNPVAAPPPASPSAIPTLSQWAMILLSLMLLAIGLVKTRRNY